MDKTVFISLPIEELQTVIIDCINVCLKTNKERKSNQPETDNPITIQGVSELTGLTIPTLYGYCQRNEIPYSKKGNRLYFFKTEIIDWIKAGKSKTLKELQLDAEAYLSNKKKGLNYEK